MKDFVTSISTIDLICILKYSWERLLIGWPFVTLPNLSTVTILNLPDITRDAFYIVSLPQEELLR